MQFKNETVAYHFLSNVSYYRLKGYWWDMQTDTTNHIFNNHTYFEDIIDRYNFDRHLRIILFDAIERIEIALRSKMIHHLSLAYGSLWYLDASIFDNATVHTLTLNDLKIEFSRSHEIFIKDHKQRHPNQDAEAWKIMELASMGTLSKLYKNLQHQLPEKAMIAQGMGLNLHNELSSWIEAITYVRNIVAHHSRLWSRNMVKRPIERIVNPMNDWISDNLLPVQSKKPFLIISCMLYLCNTITPNHHIKNKLLQLINDNPNIPIYKLGFLNHWQTHPIWKI